jgi:hypothetical protein
VISDGRRRIGLGGVKIGLVAVFVETMLFTRHYNMFEVPCSRARSPTRLSIICRN